MSSFPRTPRIIKGGIVLIDPDTAAVNRIISLQYNSDKITRTLQVQSIGGDSGERSEALRLTGPPVETIKLEAEIDATDQLEFPEENALAVRVGLHAQLAALETIIYPSSTLLEANNALANSGVLQILPAEAPLTLFVWSEKRIVPVRITEFSITEDAFDTSLNPIRANISLGMRVLNVNDLGFEHKGGNIYMTYHKTKERLSQQHRNATLSGLGVGGVI